MLNTNYRSTSQIVDYSAKVLGKEEGMIRSVRSGEEPVYMMLSKDASDEALAETITRICDSAVNSGMESIAFITRTRTQADRLAKVCGFKGNTGGRLRKYFLPVYLAKGLEFDAVAVYGENDPFYKTEEGSLVLYTACTRALHRLILLRLE